MFLLRHKLDVGFMYPNRDWLNNKPTNVWSNLVKVNCIEARAQLKLKKWSHSVIIELRTENTTQYFLRHIREHTCIPQQSWRESAEGVHTEAIKALSSPCSLSSNTRAHLLSRVHADSHTWTRAHNLKDKSLHKVLLRSLLNYGEWLV